MGRRGSPRIRDVTELRSPPGANELELAIIGPGYGESVIVHTGDGRWAVVDSCVSARTKVPQALDYLAALGVDPAESVDLVVATHWHMDHVRGIGRLARTCRRADFCCPAVFTSREALTLAGAMAGHDTGPTGALATEMREAMSALIKRSSRPRFAIANRRILRRGECEVWSLSPGDKAVVRSVGSASKELAVGKPAVALPGTLLPNQASVVLWLKVKDVVVVLGSDLHRTDWTDILGDVARPQGRASVLKVPHHGSSDAHEPRVWTEIMTEDAVAVVTPFRGGRNPPPTREDLQNILEMTSDAYLTSEPKAARSVTALKQEVGEASQGKPADPTIEEPSMVRLRRGFESPDGWKVATFGGACHLQDYLRRTLRE